MMNLPLVAALLTCIFAGAARAEAPQPAAVTPPS